MERAVRTRWKRSFTRDIIVNVSPHAMGDEIREQARRRATTDAALSRDIEAGLEESQTLDDDLDSWEVLDQ